MQFIIKRVEDRVREFCATQDGAHDWEHIRRVRDMAMDIAAREGGNLVIIELAALVHDVGDYKTHGSEEAGYRATQALLIRCGVRAQERQQVQDIAMAVSFKGFGVSDMMSSLEGRIVQDADRLDAIGAIAIARTFTWGGAKSRPIHDPSEPIFRANNAEEYYAKGGRTSINHFHEKLLHLKDRLHTETAKAEGERRHLFMQLFLAQFDHEWKAKV